QLDDNRLHPAVRRKQVRPEADRDEGQPTLLRPRERAFQLRNAPRLHERTRPPADPDGRQPRQRNVLVDDESSGLWSNRHAIGTLRSPTRHTLAATLILGAGRESAPGEG